MKHIIEGIARFDHNACAQLIGDTDVDLVFDRLCGKRVRVTVETVEEPAKRWRWVRSAIGNDYLADGEVRLHRVGANPKDRTSMRAIVWECDGEWRWNAWEHEGTSRAIKIGQVAATKSAAKRAAREAVECYDREHEVKP